MLQKKYTKKYKKNTVVILAGGLGTRISEETKTKPKPMVKILKDPILLNIIQIYNNFGFSKFIIAGGYKINFIKEYFKKKKLKNIEIKIINTGKTSMTGGRIYKLKKYLENESFMVTYGDGLANINLEKLISFHKKSKLTATITVVRPPARWGYVTINKNFITKFEEKNQLNEGWINSGFFIFEKNFFNFFKSFKNKNSIILEKDILPKIAKKKQLQAFKHYGFWKCVDTLRDKEYLEKIQKKFGKLWLNFTK